MNSSASRNKAVVALALVCVIWGYNWIAMKVGLAYAGPFKFAGIRFLLAAIVLIPIALWQREPLLPARIGWPHTSSQTGS